MIEKIGTIKNPLTSIAIFAAIAEISGTVVLPFIAEANQSTYVWFLSRTSRNQKGNINPRSCARFSDVQPIYVLANVLGLTKRKFVTHWV